MDSKTFESQFMPCRKKIFAVTYHIVGDAGEAEDVVQDVFLKLWQMHDQLDDVSMPEAYATTLAKHLSIDHLRTARYHNDCNAALDFSTDAPDTSQQERMESSDLLRQTLCYMDSLPEPQRTVMRLRNLQEATDREIMEATGLSAENVRVILSRTRKKLREWITNR